jgi:hypothetical protein
MDSDLFAYLVAQSSLTALVGKRVYPSDEVPKTAAVPYVTYERTNNPGIHLMTADADVFSPSYEVNVFASTKESLKSIEDVIVTLLKDYSGTMGSTTVQRCFYEDSYYGGYDQDIETYNQMIEFTIWHA